MTQLANKIDHRRLVLCVHDLLLEHCPHCVATAESQIRCEAKPCSNPAEDGFVFCRECSEWAGRILRDQPTTEDLAAEHDEVLAEVSEALGMWQRNHKAWSDNLREMARLNKQNVTQFLPNMDYALANLSPEAREQLESRRVVVLDGTTYVVDASGDELQLLVSDPWVIS